MNLHDPVLKGNEKKYLNECIDSGWIASGGKFIELFEKEVKKYTNAKSVCSIINGTSAIHLALKVLGVKKDQEVIVPALTFIAPINAVNYLGAEPIFMDCDQIGNIDTCKVEQFLDNETFFRNGKTFNKKTKKHISCIVLVHVFGNAIFLDRLIKICKKHKIKVVEDASESLGTFYTQGKFKNKHTGTIGDVGCYSFNANKIITAGGGGIISSNDSKIIKKAMYLSAQAKDDAFNYDHQEIGYNYRLSNMHAAIGLAQIERIEEIIDHKKKLHEEYIFNLKNNDNFKILDSPNFSRNNCWLNVVSFLNKKKEFRDKLIKKFLNRGINVRPIWKLNNTQKPYLKKQTYKVNTAKKIVSNSICLPSGFGVSQKDVKKICLFLNE